MDSDDESRQRSKPLLPTLATASGELQDNCGIGRAAVWLASDFTDFNVGSTIYIDGGMTLYPGVETGG